MTFTPDDAEMTPEKPLADRIKWLIGKGISMLFAKRKPYLFIKIQGGGALTVCKLLKLRHLVKSSRRTEAEAEVALELALHDSGLKVEEGGKI